MWTHGVGRPRKWLPIEKIGVPVVDQAEYISDPVDQDQERPRPDIDLPTIVSRGYLRIVCHEH